MPPTGYCGLQEESDTFPNTTLKLYHAKESFKESKTNLVTKRVLDKKDILYINNEWNELTEQGLSLRDRTRRANKDLVEVTSSIARFRDQIRDNTRQKQQLASRIKDVTLEVLRNRRIKEAMETYIKLNVEKFPIFLDKVAESSAEFNSVQDVLDRFATLEYCKNECSRIINEEMEEAAAMKRDVNRVLLDKSSVLGKINNSFLKLRDRHKDSTERLVHGKKTMKKLAYQFKVGTDEAFCIENGCYDLYSVMCRRRQSKPTIEKHNIKDQLKFIRDTILFYKDVYQVATMVKHDQSAALILKSKGQYKQKNTLITNILEPNNTK